MMFYYSQSTILTSEKIYEIWCVYNIVEINILIEDLK